MIASAKKVIPYFILFFVPVLSVFFLTQINAKPIGVQKYEVALNEDGAIVTLPESWLGHEKNKINAFGFKFEIIGSESFINQKYAYFHAFERDIEVFVNGIQITDLAEIIPWRGPLSVGSALVPLPESILQEEVNEVYVKVFTDEGRKGALSSLYLGDSEELEGYFRLRKFTSNHLKLAIFSIQIAIIISCFVLFLVRPKDYQFIYLGISMVISSTFSLGVFSDLFEILIFIVDWSLLLVPASALMFCAFVLELEKQGRIKVVVGAAVIISIVLYGLVIVNFVDIRWLVVHVAVPLGAVSSAVAFVVLLSRFFRYPTVDRAFLSSGLFLLLLSLAYDVMLKAQIIDGGVLIAQFAWLITLVAVIIFFMMHLSRLAIDLDSAAVTLSEKLRQREAELSDIFEREKIMSKRLAVKSQRAHIMTELHDGVAGHLSTIIALTDLDDPKPKEIHSVARHALSELRTVINALDLPEGSLLSALASIREILVGPLERIGIEVQWSFIDFPDVEWLSPEQVLSVVRIIQEATTNAVQHGRPQKLIIEGKGHDSQMCVIRVINFGGERFAPIIGAKQYGLRNMEQRAQRLGGRVTISGLPDGAKLEFILPLYCASPTH